MGSIESVDGQSLAVEQVDLLQSDISETYRQLGISVPNPSQPRPVRPRTKTKKPYVRTMPREFFGHGSAL